MNNPTPAFAFSPGEFLRDELEERGWTSADFARIINRPAQVVSEILNGKKEITPATAVSIGEALGTSAELWLNLQTSYALARERSREVDAQLSDIRRRARIRELVPITEVQRRSWISTTKDLDELEYQVANLLAMQAITDTPSFALAARRSNSIEALTPAQVAWLGHVRRAALDIDAEGFNLDHFREVAASIPALLASGPTALRSASSALASAGVRLVFCQGLRGGKLDGVATIADDGGPVVALTARGNRFDGLVFTLLHECAHIALGHLDGESKTIVDEDVRGGADDPRELEADQQALEWIFPGGLEQVPTDLPALMRLAETFGIHPSLAVGHMQWRHGRWSLHRNQIPKVFDVLDHDGMLV